MKKRTGRSPVANYFHNRTLELTAHGEPYGDGIRLPVDERGMIVDQQLLRGYRMAAADSADCGCGWVACYNALRLLGRPQRPESVIKALEHDYVLRGHLGTRTISLPFFFAARGFAVRLSFTRAGAEKNAAAAAANILYYVRGRHPSAHFVAFAAAGQDADGTPLYRFYNSLSAPLGRRSAPAGEQRPCWCAGGSAGDRRTLAALLAPEHAVFKAVLSISNR